MDETDEPRGCGGASGPDAGVGGGGDAGTSGGTQAGGCCDAQPSPAGPALLALVVMIAVRRRARRAR
jgi:hypothetical protein